MPTTRLVLLAALIVCVVLPSAAGAAGWAPLPSPWNVGGATVSDGLRYVVFQTEDRQVAVFDAAPGNGVTLYRVADECAPFGDASLRAVGGRRVLVECRDRDGVRPVLLTLYPGVWAVPPALATPVAAPGAGFGALGERWLERRTNGAATEWVDWRTGTVKRSRPGEQRVPDPDRAELWVAPCAGMRPTSAPHAYESPFGIAYGAGGGLRLTRCGSSLDLQLDPFPSVQGAQLAYGIVTWWTRSPSPRLGAYLADCGVRLLWPAPRGATIVHASRMLVQTLPGAGGGPGPLGQLEVPSACPRSAATVPLQVRSAGGRAVGVQPYAAGWLASPELGGAHARILPGTHEPTRVVLRRGGGLALQTPTATGVRWSADGGPWQRARHDGRRWEVRLGAHMLPRRLSLSLRFADGGRATYRLNVAAGNR